MASNPSGVTSVRQPGAGRNPVPDACPMSRSGRLRDVAGRLACVPLCTAMLLLGGCMHATDIGSVRHYTLGPPAPVAARTPVPHAQSARVLRIAPIEAPQWLVGTQMHYRLGYRSGNQLAAYTRSDWVSPPAVLLQSAVRDVLATGSGWRAVLGPRNPASADLTLHLQLDDFSQSFPQPDRSFGVLDATATLVDNHRHTVLAQHPFHVRVAAPSADAEGGAIALGDASRKFAAELRTWLRDIVSRTSSKPPALARTCPQPGPSQLPRHEQAGTGAPGGFRRECKLI